MLNPHRSAVASEPGASVGRAWSVSRGVLLSACASALYLALFARVLWRIGDEGMIVHGAQRVLEGQVPYVDFVEAIAPGSFYWLAGYFKLFGTSWFALRTHLVLSGAAISALIYYLTRFLIPGRFAVVPCALFTVLGVPLWTASSHHWDSLMFSLVATACFLEWQRHGRPVLLSVSGVSAAVTTCIMPQKGGALLVALVAILVVSRYAHSTFPVGSHIRRLAVPYALTLAGCVLCLMYAGALAAAFEATVVWPLTQYQSINRLPYAWGALTLPIGRSLSLLPSTPAVLIGTAAFVSFWCFLTVVLLPVLAPLLLVVAYRRGTNATVLRDPPLLSALAIGYAMWLGELQRPDFYHLMWGSPVLLVAVFVLLVRGVSPTLRTATCWALCLSIVVVGTINVAITLDARETLSTRRGTMRAFNSDPALSFVMANVRPGEPVFVYPYYPMYYYLADVRNPTRYSLLLYGFHTSRQFDEVVRVLDRQRVTYVVWDTVAEGQNLRTWFPSYVHPPLEQRHLERYLTENYESLGLANGFRLLRRRHER